MGRQQNTDSQEPKGTAVTIEKLVHGGHGLTRDEDGRIVFVKDVIPGEKVEISDIQKKHGAFWAENRKILTPSVDRTGERCPQTATCGGCQFIYMKPKREHEEKQLIFQNVISRAGIENPHGQVSHSFNLPGSRHRGTLHFSNGQLGFFSRSSHLVSPVQGCKVIPLPALEFFMTLAEFFRANPGLEGKIRFVVCPETFHLTLELRFEGAIEIRQKKDLINLLGKSDRVQSAALVIKSKKKDLRSGPLLTFTWNKHHPQISVGTFFQSNPASWRLFWNLLKDWAKSIPEKEWLWDVHAGSGFLSSALPHWKIFATEPDRQRFLQLERVTTRSLCETAEKALVGDLPSPLAGMILDPPRVGLSKKLRDWILEHGPQHLAMFSCDPGTFVRDLNHLLQRYSFAAPFHLMDVNPGTNRLEVFVCLVRKDESS